MTPEIHRAALRAAAKLAFSVMVGGCGGATVETPPDPTGTPGATPVDTSGDDLSVSRGSSVGSYCSKHHHGETQHACCEAEVAGATFPKDARSSDKPDMRVDALTRACCTVLAHDADKTQTFSWPERTQCCEAIGWSAAATCTPWGPPVPPAMPLLLA